MGEVATIPVAVPLEWTWATRSAAATSSLSLGSRENGVVEKVPEIGSSTVANRGCLSFTLPSAGCKQEQGNGTDGNKPKGKM